MKDLVLLETLDEVSTLPRQSSLMQGRKSELISSLCSQICSGVPRHKQLAFIVTNFGVSYEAAGDFIDLAFDVMSSDLVSEIAQNRVLSKARRMEIYQTAIAVGDLKVALDVLKDLSRLNGEYGGSNNQAIEQLKDLINSLDSQANSIEGEIVDEDE